MKKLAIFLVCMIGLQVAACADDHKKPITVNELPQTAQTFIKEKFSNERITLVTRERENLLYNSYDVVFTSGVNVEFNSKGDWTEVDCKTNAVPAGIVPEAIAKDVASRFPNTTITKIEKDDGYFEISLNNRMELKYNKSFVLVDIDD